MRHLWSIFSQAVTVCLGILFVLKLFYPTLLTQPVNKTLVIKETAATSQAMVAKSGYRNAVSKAMPSVVNIFTTARMSQDPHRALKNDPLFRHFFGDEIEEEDEQPENSLGSGVIVSADGLILTNNHVISSADQIEVALSDGSKSSATVVGTDPETDLAVLKIDRKQLPAITFSNSDQMKVGDVVLAIGNPFGVGQTVTQGIISALGRNHLGINTFENFIQTDASINPGNSGGALIDVNGNLIGINSAIYSRNGGSMGIGFAIPVSIAKQVMEQITFNGSVTRGWIGIEAQDITPELAESFNLKNVNGSLIAGVLLDSPADRAGLRPGDILIAIDNKPVSDSQAMLNIIAMLKPRDKATLAILRAGKKMEISLIVGKRPLPSKVAQ
ncbi:S1C family serine protease [Methylophilus glucosoxydans]|jgi:serine protease DegQ|uniref:S1C family serine protease n=1 Tax=Methylophilus glucosoxydans TaxID=752553 RepID=A0ABW3GEY5_9PROT|nr:MULTISPECIES: Do family serine endopeptidase [unclassified Methylophilus]MBF5039691.1 Do family serine endopeptidase [Methylophilus sp. 13]MDT7848937.1 Do family serine endopeptidase [Methylophilus sp. VKM B-3414]